MSDVRPIDANTLCYEIVKTGDVDFINKITGILKDAPTIEPKHGKWIDKGWHGDWQFETDGRGNCWHEYECSECGFHNQGSKSNFCPNCGVDMRGKNNETI